MGNQHAWDFTTTSTISGGEMHLEDSYTPQERAALVTYQIMSGASLTTAEIAQKCGMTWLGAYRMMERISRVVPVTQDENNRGGGGSRWGKFD